MRLLLLCYPVEPLIMNRVFCFGHHATVKMKAIFNIHLSGWLVNAFGVKESESQEVMENSKICNHLLQRLCSKQK